MSSSLSACLARAMAAESSAATARASSTEPAASLSSLAVLCCAGCEVAAAGAAVVVSSSPNSSQLSMAVSPDWGPVVAGRKCSGGFWFARKSGVLSGEGGGARVPVFCFRSWFRAGLLCCLVGLPPLPSPLPRGERGWSGFGPGHLCCLVRLPLTLALSPEGRGDRVGVASGYALTRLRVG